MTAQETYVRPSNLQDDGIIKIPESPALAPGVQLVGEMLETGFAEKQWLAVRNGKFIQLGELLFRVAQFANGERTLDEIARRMTETTEWTVTAEHIRKILEKMIPLGIIATEEAEEASSEPVTTDRENTASTLGITMHTQVLGPHIIQPIANFLKFFYEPVALITLLIVMGVAHIWLYFEQGLAKSFMDALYRPWGFLIIIGLLILAGIFHEFGHAAALVYGGGRVRGMGTGLVVIYPAFYTDLTDSYRLGRWARVRTDLGGFYFYLIFALGIIGLYFLTGYEFLLLAVAFINLDILYQSLPFVKMDGYWVMADLTGIPDPMTYMKPFLASLITARSAQPTKVAPLRPQVRRVFLIYTLLTIPIIFAVLAFTIFRLPRFLIRLYDTIVYQIQVVSLAWQHGDIPGVVILVLTILLLSTMIFGSLYVFFTLARRFVKGLWSWSQPTPKRRMSGSIIALAVVALLGFSWFPQFQTLFKEAPKDVQTFQITSRNHTDQPVSYEQSPPVGEDHAPVWQNCGFYDTPIQDENAVHSLEHGAVWIAYRPDLPKNQVTALRQLAYRQAYVLVSPYADLQAPVVASAWGKQLRLESMHDTQLEQFIRVYRLSEQAPEAGEPCIGGVGSPK